MSKEKEGEDLDLLKKNGSVVPVASQNRRHNSQVDKPWSFVVALASFTAQVQHHPPS